MNRLLSILKIVSFGVASFAFLSAHATEMVAVNLDNHPATNIPYSESYRNSSTFYDDAKQNWDHDFWKDYNIIESTESLHAQNTKNDTNIKKFQGNLVILHSD